MSQLVVIKFDSVETAKQVRQALAAAAKQGLVRVEDAAVIHKDAAGKVSVDNEVSSSMWYGLGVGALLGALISFVFPLAGVIAGAAGGAAVAAASGRSVDSDFVKQVRDDLPPNTSALFVLGTGDIGALRAVLEPYQGTLYQTTLDSSAEEQLRNALK